MCRRSRGGAGEGRREELWRGAHLREVAAPKGMPELTNWN